MRTVCPVRWAPCALALSIVMSAFVAPAFVAPAFADRPGRSLASCTSFDQVDRGEDKVAFTIHNTCTIPVDCSVSWRVVCAPESKKRRASHASSAKLAIADGSSQSAEASAAVCGDDGWMIDSVHWACQPNKD